MSLYYQNLIFLKISNKILCYDNIATNDIQFHFKPFKISEGVDHFYTAIGIKEWLHRFVLIKTV